MDSSVFLWAQIGGGLALFLMGVSATSEGFSRCMGRSARHRLAEVTDRKSMAFGLGLLLSAVTQSSAVATSFAVGLVDVGMLSLSGSLVVMIGASVGGTFVTILLGLPVVQLAPGFLAIAHLSAGMLRGKSHNVATVVRGVTLVLTGMFLIKNGVSPLMTDPYFSEILTRLSSSPTMIGSVAALAAAVMQSSAAVMALAIALASSGSLPMESLYPIVLGSHVGSSFIVLMASLSGKKNARLLGIGSALYKVFGIAVLTPFYPLIPKFLEMISFLSVEMRCVALQFCVVWMNALMFLPFTGFMSRMLKLLPSGEGERVGEPAYLDPRLVDFPGLALPLLDRELARLAGFMEKEIEILLSKDRVVDLSKLRSGTEDLWNAISDYFDTIETSGISEGKGVIGRISYTLEALRGVKDAINQGIYTLVVSEDGGRSFWGEKDIPMMDQYGHVLVHLVRSAMGSLALGDLGLAGDVDRFYEKLKDLDESIRRDVFRRGSYGRGGLLEFLARGTQLAKACVQVTKGEKMALEMSLQVDGRGGDAGVVRKDDE